MNAPTKNADCARPTLYSSPQMRPHSETVEIPFPPTHSHKLGSREQRAEEGVQDVAMSIRPALGIHHKSQIVIISLGLSKIFSSRLHLKKQVCYYHHAITGNELQFSHFRNLREIPTIVLLRSTC